jgi:uncharacterized protein (TIGR03083 family)
MDTLENLVTVVQSESERLTRYLYTLPPNAWTRPSACERWEVRDVVGHLTWVAELYADGISRGIQEDVSPPAGFPPAGTSTGASFNEFIAQSSIACREQLGGQLLATFGAYTTQLHRLLAGLSPQVWEKPCYHPVSIRPVQAFLSMWIQELVIHGWDIRSRVETHAPLSAESLHVLMARIPARLGGLLGRGTFRFDARAPMPVRYRFVSSGAVPSTHDMLIENEKARMEPAGTAPPHVTFHCDTDIFVLMMYQRLTLEPVIASGQLVVEGDQGLAAAFDHWLKGA